MTPEQMLKARRLLNWSRDRLAVRLDVSSATVGKFENEGRIMADLDLSKAHEVFEAAGVEFIVENGGGAGVTLRKRGPAAIAIEDLNASNDE